MKKIGYVLGFVIGFYGLGLIDGSIGPESIPITIAYILGLYIMDITDWITKRIKQSTKLKQQRQ